jgi:hypothetical protein
VRLTDQSVLAGDSLSLQLHGPVSHVASGIHPTRLSVLVRELGSFTDTATFDIAARRGDRLSFAAMLICTNDGFLGLDGAHLPDDDSRTFLLVGWDAGRENNTERQQDIVEPCSVLGPVVLPGVHPTPGPRVVAVTA